MCKIYVALLFLITIKYICSIICQDISIFTKLLFVGYERDYDYDFWNIEKYSQVENIFLKDCILILFMVLNHTLCLAESQ